MFISHKFETNKKETIPNVISISYKIFIAVSRFIFNWKKNSLRIYSSRHLIQMRRTVPSFDKCIVPLRRIIKASRIWYSTLDVLYFIVARYQSSRIAKWLEHGCSPWAIRITLINETKLPSERGVSASNRSRETIRAPRQKLLPPSTRTILSSFGYYGSYVCTYLTYPRVPT